MGTTAPFTPSDGPKRRLPLWTAALPALLIPVFFASRAALQFSAAANAINPASSTHQKNSNLLPCVETYSVTLDSSQLYVPEWQVGMPAVSQNGTPQLSTVLRGMARNGCGENLKNVHLRFAVHDDKGQKGDGYISFDTLAIGEAKPFEKAWMGRVTSYEITANR